MIERVAKDFMALPLTAREWKLQMQTITNVIGVRAAARINGHVAALEERIASLERAQLQLPGPGIRRMTP